MIRRPPPVGNPSGRLPIYDHASINWNINNNTGWYPSINLDEQGWGGGLHNGLDAMWMLTSLPNPSGRMGDDNGDGRYEEVRVWARSAIGDSVRYYAYAKFNDPAIITCCNTPGTSGQINYSAYRVDTNGNHAAVNGIVWLGKLYFTASIFPEFRCEPNSTLPNNCVQSP
jgi:hypothetical protein